MRPCLPDSSHAEPPGRRDEPVSPPARPQPGGLAPLGPRGAREGAANPIGRSSCRSAIPPATGATSWSARASRTRRSRRRMNEQFVCDQGRPRGAPRPRRRLHGRGPGDDRIGRLADERLPDPRSATRSTAAPTSHPRTVTAWPGFPRVLEAVADAYREPTRRGRAAGRRCSPATSRPSSPSRRATGTFSPGSSRRRPPGLPARFDAVHAGFGGAPKFPAPMALEFLLRTWRRTQRRRPRSRSSRARSTRWPPAASTTSWAAASPATAPMPAGWSRTSRRCSTTTPCWPTPTSRPTAPPGPSATRRSCARRSTSCSTSCAPPREASPPPWMPTARESRGASTSGLTRSSPASWRRRGSTRRSATPWPRTGA